MQGHVPGEGIFIVEVATQQHGADRTEFQKRRAGVAPDVPRRISERDTKQMGKCFHIAPTNRPGSLGPDDGIVVVEQRREMELGLRHRAVAEAGCDEHSKRWVWM